jgi:hypothetical protein
MTLKGAKKRLKERIINPPKVQLSSRALFRLCAKSAACDHLVDIVAFILKEDPGVGALYPKNVVALKHYYKTVRNLH